MKETYETWAWRAEKTVKGVFSPIDGKKIDFLVIKLAIIVSPS